LRRPILFPASYNSNSQFTEIFNGFRAEHTYLAVKLRNRDTAAAFWVANRESVTDDSRHLERVGLEIWTICSNQEFSLAIHYHRKMWPLSIHPSKYDIEGFSVCDIVKL
jgi:hypothetical protein